MISTSTSAERGASAEDEKHTILVVDDNEDLLETIAETLADFGYDNVKTAPNGRDAMALIDAGLRPCLIILDLMMPVMDGWEVLYRLQSNPDTSRIKVLILTAVGSFRSPSNDIDVLHKPFRAEALLEAARRFC